MDQTDTAPDSPLSRISTAEAVVNYFREAIRMGEYIPGESIPSERVLQAKFGISRFSLREGMARLNALGLVEIRHGKGTTISRSIRPEAIRDAFIPMYPQQSKETLEDLLEARYVLEAELSALAAERATPDDLEALRNNISEMERKMKDSNAFYALDLEFHQIIARMARNSYLFQMHAILWDQMVPLLKKLAESQHKRKKTLSKHQTIAEALAGTDPDSAREVSRRGILSAKQDYLD